MTETSRQGSRHSKASLGRIKLLAVILSVVAFIGSLAGVAIANPGTSNRPVQTVQPAAGRRSPNLQGLSSDEGLVVPSRPSLPRVRPMTRTRGS
jgi:hypothetical protein